jgi:zinc finger HIT domain-containing protein 1
MSKKPEVSKRASTRTIVVSKAMRTVDKETRREVRDKRITMLEADNYEEEATIDYDDAYEDDEVNY